MTEQPKSQCKCPDCNLPELETLSYKPEQSNQIAGIDKTDRICPNCGKEKSIYMLKCFNCETKPEQPNTELLIVKTIQGLTTCINNELEKLSNENTPYNSKTMDIRDKALEEIDLFEKTTLFELQRCFE